MFDNSFELNEQSMPFIEEIGRHMPGGFFIYKAEQPEELLYANKACFDIFGCADLEEFRALTGYTFKGMVYEEDYDAISASINEQIDASEDNMDYVEYRIIRKDGAIRWVDDYGHYLESMHYGGVYYVFISDITEKRNRAESDKAFRSAVIEALTKPYDSVWLISDLKTQRFELYRIDEKTVHLLPAQEAVKLTRFYDACVFYSKLIVEEDRQGFLEAVTPQSIEENTFYKHIYSVQFRRIFESGIRYYRLEFIKVDLPNGKIGIVAGFRDVDDEVRQKQAYRQALEDVSEAEAKNRRLMEEMESAAKLADLMASMTSLVSNMPAMSFSKDVETGKYLACNQPFAEYAHKKTPDEVVGLTDFDIFDLATAKHFVEDDKKALSMDEPFIFFEDVPDATGETIRNLQTTKMKFTDSSGRLCLLGMCVDVTEIARMKASEARQQEMETRLALQEELLEQSNMITAMASDYRNVYHVNLDEDDAVCYRADPADPDQHPVGVHFPFHERFADYGKLYVDEEYLEGFLNFIEPRNIRKALSKENIISYRYLVRRNGKEYYEMFRMAGVRRAEDRDDHTVHAVGVGFTIIDAEMRETLAKNHALSEALDAAEQANRAKTSFLSSMSHEIRTPMNAIIGLDSLALRKETLDDETQEYLEKIGGSARHLLGLINDILDMSRIESGRMVLRREEFFFRNMLEQINTMVMSQCEEKGLKYECIIKNDVNDYYIGDDMKLKQVLINILSNAIKFTDAPGSVTLSVEQTTSFKDQATLRFTIKDTGIGMEQSFIPKIFDSFSQEDSNRNNKYGSTGLGMAITKNIVGLMNGSISVKSEKGVGTEFTVIVSLKKSDHQAPVLSYVKPEDMHVLVVDDEEIAAEHARLVLEEVGIKSDISLSGAEAMQMLEIAHTKHLPYNLVIIDWKMPEMDGIELSRQIRMKYSRETSVIIQTSFNWDDILDEAMHIGVDNFLAKPLAASNVIDEIERIARKNSTDIDRENRRVDLKGKHILLAEDVIINAEIIKEVLGVKEAVVDHANNGKQALEMFLNSTERYYDAILMDVRMPEMDGLQTTSAIRSLDRPDAKTIPIIALTANAFDEDVQRSLQVGMNSHLSKPVEPEHLYLTLEELIWENEN